MRMPLTPDKPTSGLSCALPRYQQGRPRPAADKRSPAQRDPHPCQCTGNTSPSSGAVHLHHLQQKAQWHSIRQLASTMERQCFGHIGGSNRRGQRDKRSGARVRGSGYILCGNVRQPEGAVDEGAKWGHDQPDYLRQT
ncbi:hypothetical protein BS78_09G005900 [Paspalum vaginatum]|nr:hypothetical protein BS78_09G005900 [Paspalum vaginatum]